MKAWQPRRGFRAGIDSVLLAAACPASPGEEVLELGCGPGIAALCLEARVRGATVTGVEKQENYAEIAQRNGLVVWHADLEHMPLELRQRQFHHVMFNPPYFDPARGAAAPDAGRHMARAEDTPLPLWFEAAEKRLRAKGSLTVIHRAEKLADILGALGPTLGSVRVLPLAPRAGRDPHLILLRARKDGRAPLRLHRPLILHEGTHHEADSPDYTPLIASILQNGAALPFPD
ncbi:MAG: methyltransferase domain-containing protein [Pseudomonadota bacterium]